MQTADHLMDAFDSHTRAVARIEAGDRSFAAVTAEIRAINRLYDAAIDAGMPIGHADLAGWAAERITQHLVSA